MLQAVHLLTHILLLASPGLYPCGPPCRLHAAYSSWGCPSLVVLLAPESAQSPGLIGQHLGQLFPPGCVLRFQLSYAFFCCHGFILAALATPPKQLQRGNRWLREELTTQCIPTKGDRKYGIIQELTRVVRQCLDPECPGFHKRYRPEEDGRWALPHGEFG